jgi:hypothetical protein
MKGDRNGADQKNQDKRPIWKMVEASPAEENDRLLVLGGCRRSDDRDWLCLGWMDYGR